MQGWLVAALALSCAGIGWAQAPCPQAWDVKQADLLGTWRAEFSGQWHGATLVLEKHPEYAESFRGAVRREDGQRSVAGDIDEGDFTLEESADGTRIAATWIGEVVEGSCGKEIRGTWKAEGSDARREFVLRKAGS